MSKKLYTLLASAVLLLAASVARADDKADLNPPVDRKCKTCQACSAQKCKTDCQPACAGGCKTHCQGTFCSRLWAWATYHEPVCTDCRNLWVRAPLNAPIYTFFLYECGSPCAGSAPCTMGSILVPETGVSVK